MPKQNNEVDRFSALAKHLYVGSVFSQLILLSRVHQQKRVNQEPGHNYNDNGNKYGNFKINIINNLSTYLERMKFPSMEDNKKKSPKQTDEQVNPFTALDGTNNLFGGLWFC